MTASHGCGPNDRDAEGGEDDDPPFCVVKSFPFTESHAVDWAAAKVDALTRAKPEAYNTFFATTDGDKEELATAIQGGVLFSSIVNTNSSKQKSASTYVV